MGQFIEHYHRTVAFDALLGGGAWFPRYDSGLKGLNFFPEAEDVLADLGIRQALRVMPKDAKL
jgi:hypothetical protein